MSYRFSGVKDVPAITRLSYPAGYEWLKDLHESNLPIEAKIQIVNNHHNNLIMDKVIEYQLKQSNRWVWLIPIMSISIVSVLLIVKALL